MSYPPLRSLFFLIIFVAAFVAVFRFPPIAQDLEYHNFADQRIFLGIPHFFDVVSNIPYLFVGVLGLLTVYRSRNDGKTFCHSGESFPVALAFLGIFFVGLGSGYYHLAPNNVSLVWDRLPMTIGFMAIFAMVLGERIQLRLGLWSLPILLFLGVASVWYWYVTELAGAGDLRPYFLVQFLPILLIPILLFMMPARYQGTRYLWLMLGWYVLAKVLEHFDSEVFSLLSVVSGHTLKHLASAMACYELVRYVRHRSLID